MHQVVAQVVVRVTQLLHRKMAQQELQDKEILAEIQEPTLEHMLLVAAEVQEL
jgi:hypothetical protein